MANEYNYDVDRPIKGFVRNQLWSRVKGTAKKVLLLPGRDCLDIKAGIDAGKINPKTTELYLFESRKDIAKIIRANCKKMGLRHAYIYPTSVHKEVGKDVIESVENFDLMFFDFCGYVKPEIIDFLEWLCPKTQDPANIIAFTFSVGLRNNPLYNLDPQFNKTFHPPTGSICPWSSETKDKAAWTAQKTLKTIKKTDKDLIDFIHYNDTGSPMLFFSIDFTEGNLQGLSPYQKAWITRRHNSAMKKAA